MQNTAISILKATFNNLAWYLLQKVVVYHLKKTVHTRMLFPGERKAAMQVWMEQLPAFPQKAVKSEEHTALSSPISSLPSKLQENVTIHLMEQQT